MSIQSPPATAPVPDRAKVMEDYLAYRRLLYRGYILYARITLLQCLLWMVSPIATPMIVLTIRRWFDQVAADVRVLSRAVRSLRERVAMEKHVPAPVVPVFQNPWT